MCILRYFLFPSASFPFSVFLSGYRSPTEVVSTSGSTSKGGRFKSRPEDRPPWQDFCGIPQTLEVNAGLTPQ
jgi:hypothetical protein